MLDPCPALHRQDQFYIFFNIMLLGFSSAVRSFPERSPTMLPATMRLSGSLNVDNHQTPWGSPWSA